MGMLGRTSGLKSNMDPTAVVSPQRDHDSGVNIRSDNDNFYVGVTALLVIRSMR